MEEKILKKYEGKVCCVCGKQAVKAMQYTGGERYYPPIYYCDDHGEYNDDIGFHQRSCQPYLYNTSE